METRLEKLAAVLLLFSVIVMEVSAATPSKQSPKKENMMPERQECAKIENRLYQLVQSSEPEQTARESGLHYPNGSVRIIIELTDPNPASFPGYSLIIESRYDRFIQALVAPGELCKLSEMPVIRFIRAPFEANHSER